MTDRQPDRQTEKQKWRVESNLQSTLFAWALLAQVVDESGTQTANTRLFHFQNE